MAYPLSQILPRSPIVPDPVSPVVRDGYRRRFVAVFVGACVLWFLVFATFAFVSVPILVANDGGVFTMIMEMTGASINGASGLFMMGVMITLVTTAGASMSIASLAGYVRRWAGYRKRGSKDTEAQGTIWITVAPVAVGAVPGLIAAAIGSATRGEVAMALAWAAATALVGYLAVRIGRRAASVLARLRERMAERDRILAHGRRSVARVEKMHATRNVIDERTEFAAILVSDHGGERTAIDVRVIEHPIWAPVPGTEFDVWTTDDRPLDAKNADRILVERRYVGQDGPTDAMVYRRSNGEGAQRMGPRWMAPGEDAVTRDVHGGGWRVLLQGIALGARFLGTFLCAIVVVALIAAGAAPTTVATFGLVFAVSAVDARLALARLQRSRWCVRNRLPMFMVIPLWMTMMLVMMVPMSDETIYSGGEDGDFTTVGAVTAWVAATLMILSFLLLATAVHPPHLFNRGFEAPAELIQQAMTSHDPSLADRLEARTGVRVGVALLGWEFTAND